MSKLMTLGQFASFLRKQRMTPREKVGLLQTAAIYCFRQHGRIAHRVDVQVIDGQVRVFDAPAAVIEGYKVRKFPTF